ncbi:MAG: class I SAM-dependent methyltransferase, partial [Promethearchaeota archaeon]
MWNDEKKVYWDNRYAKEGKIWGNSPSNSALYALKLFKKYGIYSILIPGAGYGRHTKFFSHHDYEVTGIEISKVAIEIARRFDPKSKFINKSAITIEKIFDEFDAIFCF